jgi:ligand-binding sensor domain-containing protein
VLWVSSSLGIARVSGGVASFTPQTACRDHTCSINEDRQGNSGSAGRRARTMERAVFVPSRGCRGLRSSLASDGDGGIWIGMGCGLRMPFEWKQRLFGAADGLTNEVVSSLYRDREGSLWIGTDGGLFRHRDGRFLRYGTKEGLSSLRVISIREDREGSLWVGTLDGGLNRIKEQRIGIYTTEDGLSDDRIWAVFEDHEGTLWAGTPKAR